MWRSSFISSNSINLFIQTNNSSCNSSILRFWSFIDFNPFKSSPGSSWVVISNNILLSLFVLHCPSLFLCLCCLSESLLLNFIPHRLHSIFFCIRYSDNHDICGKKSSHFCQSVRSVRTEIWKLYDDALLSSQDTCLVSKDYAPSPLKKESPHTSVKKCEKCEDEIWKLYDDALLSSQRAHALSAKTMLRHH